MDLFFSADQPDFSIRKGSSTSTDLATDECFAFLNESLPSPRIEEQCDDDLQPPPKKRSRQKFTKEEILQRRATRQARYREEQKQSQTELAHAVVAAQKDLNHANAENSWLRAHQQALQKTVEYCAASIDAVQKVASSMIPSQLIATFRTTFDATQWRTAALSMLSDSQIRFFINVPTVEEFVLMAKNNLHYMLQLSQRWLQNADDRQEIERQLDNVRRTRARILPIFAQERPRDFLHVLQQVVLPPTQDGLPNPVVIDLVHRLNFTQEQLEIIHREWELYQETVRRGREESRAAIFTSLQEAIVARSEQLPSFLKSGALMKAGEATSMLYAQPFIELYALRNLYTQMTLSLTPEQTHTMATSCYPKFADLLQVAAVAVEKYPLAKTV